jgi:hypothetical protein
VLFVERNFTDFFGMRARDDFNKCHESSLRVRRHGEVALERTNAVSGANPGDEDEGVATVESDGWLDDESHLRRCH